MRSQSALILPSAPENTAHMGTPLPIISSLIMSSQIYFNSRFLCACNVLQRPQRLLVVNGFVVSGCCTNGKCPLGAHWCAYYICHGPKLLTVVTTHQFDYFIQKAHMRTCLCIMSLGQYAALLSTKIMAYNQLQQFDYNPQRLQLRLKCK